jgi:hypothetical protein
MTCILVEDYGDKCEGGGLAHYSNQGQWQVFNTENSVLPDNYVHALLSDGQNGLWVGTDEGLAHYNNQGQWQVFNTENSGLPDNNVYALSSDGQNGLWVGTNCKWAEDQSKCKGGLAHYNNQGQWQVFNTENSGLPDNSINALLSDGQNGLWVGMDCRWSKDNNEYEGGGLAHYSSQGQWQMFGSGGSGLSCSITDLLGDGQNGLWVVAAAIPIGRGWSGGGVAHYNNQGQWQVLTSDFTSSLSSDGQNGLWVGTAFYTSEKGLQHYDNQGQLQQVFKRENSGLPYREVHHSLSDGQNGLWVSSGGGLAHLTFGRKAELCSQSQIDSAACQAIQQGKHAAIIVAAGGGQETDSLWENTEAITTRLYRTFYRRGFDKSNIYYLSSKTWADFDGDGFNDRINRISEDRHLTLDDLKKAFEWAKGLGKLDQPFYFFFMDHGGEGKLHLAPNLQLSAEDIKPLLDDYQTTTGNQLIVVIEASVTLGH